MRRIILFSIAIAIMIPLVLQSCKSKGKTSEKGVSEITLDSTLVAPFFKTYPDLKKYEKELVSIYRNYDFNYIWFDEKGTVEYASALYSKFMNIGQEGLTSTFPYQKDITAIFKDNIKNAREHPDAELLMTSLYLYYVDEVYKGIDHKTTKNIGWLLPRKKVDHMSLLDTIITEQEVLDEDTQVLFGQYYKLRDELKRYRAIQKKGGWLPIEFEKNQKAYKPNDAGNAIQQIRERLFITGEIQNNNKSNIYDAELITGVQTFQSRNGFKPDSLISTELIEAMNVPVSNYIKTIAVNMERCRWIAPETFNAEEFIFVNIPSYSMNLIRDGKVVFDSPVVVGDEMTKTVIFSGKMSYIVFSPYWNLPQSIIEKDVKPGMEKNKNYLKSKNMEWNDGQVRQLPGKNNSLGLVKFMFPNSNDIYLHDTPAKSLFERKDRALSHGCIRVGKAKELANVILKDDTDWTPAKIDAAMNAGKESTTTLKSKIPVYIAYFTAWVDEQGQLNFYKDVYERDERLAKLLFNTK